MIIEGVEAREIKDSRGNQTLEVSVMVDGKKGFFAVPSGASTGLHEAWELRNQDGSVKTAIDNVNTEINNALLGKEADQQKVDELLVSLDGTDNKKRLGGNALIGVSIALAKAISEARAVTLHSYLRELSTNPMTDKPRLFSNLINGGSHADTRLTFQEYMVVPNTDNPKSALDTILEVEKSLGEIVNSRFRGTLIGDEGGYALDVLDIELPLELIIQAADEIGKLDQISIAIDVAASSFYSDGVYSIGESNIQKEDLIKIYEHMTSAFNIISIEDPLEEEDFSGFKEVKERTEDLLVIGDDLTVTNRARLQHAIDSNSISGIIIKPNQIGTLTESIETMDLAHKNNLKCIVSHRSGETYDTFISDLAFGLGCFGLKAGSPLQDVRKTKYDRLIEISK